jgi:hypothetical protein
LFRALALDGGASQHAWGKCVTAILKKMIRAVMKPLWQNVCEPQERPFEFPPGIGIVSPWETLNACRESMRREATGAYLRFGDGDLNLLEGRDELYQLGRPDLAVEMKEAFSLHGEGILKCLPLHSKRFGLWPGMKPGVHEGSDTWAESILARAYPYFVGERIYSHVALSHVAIVDRSFAVDFLSFLKERRPVFVGNGEIEPAVLDALFGSGPRVGSPPRNSFSEADRITRETELALNCRGGCHQIVAMAMGCAGRVVAKRILTKQKYKVFFFDMGSIMDAFCGNFSRAWMENPKSYFDNLLSDIEITPERK